MAKDELPGVPWHLSVHLLEFYAMHGGPNADPSDKCDGPGSFYNTVCRPLLTDVVWDQDQYSEGCISHPPHPRSHLNCPARISISWYSVMYIL